MPQNVYAEANTTTQADREVFMKAVDMFNAEAQFAPLAKDLAINVTLKQLEPGVGGQHRVGTQDVEISPTNNGYIKSARDYMNLLVHEVTHAAQTEAAKSQSPNERSYRSPAGTALTQLKNPVDINKQLSAAGINYGEGEPAAWINANMQRGNISRDPQVLDFIQANPEFSAELFRRNAAPNRPVGTHTKGEPEMTLGEKILYKLTGYAPNVKLDIPPWTKKDIATMNMVEAYKAPKGNK